jgi:hypothetical protein
MARTRLQIKTFAIREIHGGDPGDTAVARVETAVNDAVSLLGDQRHWGYHETTHEFTTIAPYTTGTVAVAIGATSVVGTGTTFPANAVGQRIEFASERHWFEPTVVGGATALTILNAYSNPTGTALSGAAYKILYPLYDLPLNYACLAPEEPGLFDVDAGGETHDYTEMRLMQLLQSMRAGSGRLEVYGIQAKRHDPEQMQIFMYPAPAQTRRYQLVYFRRPGWFSSATPATSTWKAKATADTDVVDWPGQLDNVLNAAVLAQVAKAIKPDRYDQLNKDFYKLCSTAESMDRKAPGLMRMSRRRKILRGGKWTF